MFGIEVWVAQQTLPLKISATVDAAQSRLIAFYESLGAVREKNSAPLLPIQITRKGCLQSPFMWTRRSPRPNTLCNSLGDVWERTPMRLRCPFESIAKVGQQQSVCGSAELSPAGEVVFGTVCRRQAAPCNKSASGHGTLAGGRLGS